MMPEPVSHFPVLQLERVERLAPSGCVPSLHQQVLVYFLGWLLREALSFGFHDLASPFELGRLPVDLLVGAQYRDLQ